MAEGGSTLADRRHHRRHGCRDSANSDSQVVIKWTQGIRTHDLLAASQTGLSAMLTRESAGQKRPEQLKLFAERTTHVGRRRNSVKSARNSSPWCPSVKPQPLT